MQLPHPSIVNCFPASHSNDLLHHHCLISTFTGCILLVLLLNYIEAIQLSVFKGYAPSTPSMSSSTSTMDKEKSAHAESPRVESDDVVAVGEMLNASGHKQELERNFSLLSICAIGITTGNVWAALGGSIVCLSAIHLVTSLLFTSFTDRPVANRIIRSSRFTMVVPLASSTSSLRCHAFTS